MMRESRWLLLRLFCVLFDSVDAWSQEHGSDLVQRGQYIFSLAGGCACHTVPKGTFNAGARAFPIPFGKVYSTNITQDKETGLGSWTDQQIRDAIVKGIRPDGSRMIPVMPYERYSGMAEEDLPNITPDRETAIGDWNREDIAALLLTATKPDMDNTQGLMSEVIQGALHGFKDMKREDALAIADYLKSIAPIKNEIK